MVAREFWLFQKLQKIKLAEFGIALNVRFRGQGGLKSRLG
jgi:hypothetical protein